MKEFGLGFTVIFIPLIRLSFSGDGVRLGILPEPPDLADDFYLIDDILGWTSMQLIFLIGVGGFIGAILRYLASGWIQGNMAYFPLGTLGVNFIGSFLLGLVMYLSEYQGIFTEEVRVFLTIGLLGAFTTMSTFSYESFRLLEQNELGLLGINVFGTVFLTLFAVYLSRLIVMKIGGA